MVVVPQAKSPGHRGHWWRFRTWVVLSCPLCGVAMRLDDTHRIDADGTVTPSVRCGLSRCAFHDAVRLAEYA